MEKGEYLENGVYYYKGLLDDLDSLESYDAIKDLITPPLDDGQSVDLLKALAMKNFAVFYATGLGKTYLAAAYVKALKNKQPNIKVLMFMKKSQEDETPKKMMSISGLKCRVLTAGNSKTLTESMIDKNDIIMMTHDSLNSKRHMMKLNSLVKKFDAVIIDEMHLLSNIEAASSAFMLYSITSNIEYVLGLTATPVTTDLEQFIRVLKIIAPRYVENFRKIGSNMKNYGLSALPDELRDLFVIRDRPFNNHRGIGDFIDPMPHQIDANGKDMFLITKGEEAFAQSNRLVQLIKERRPLRGIVYINRKIIQRFVVKELENSGIKCALINGETSKEDRGIILEKFKNDEFEIVITNIKEALDMDCNFVIFYEYTPHVKQMIGRAERGLNPVPLDIIFMFTRKTGEYDYFLRNVYEISQEVQEVLDIDFNEVTNMVFYNN